MPNPQPRDQQTRKQAPKNLDALIRRAMSRGNTAELKKALQDAEEVAFEPVEAPVVHELTDDDPTPLGELVQKVEQPTVTPDGLYQDVRALVEAASRWEDDPRGAERDLDQARRAIAQLLGLLSGVEGPPELVLPPFRQAFALFVEPSGTPDDAALVADALGIDHPTARMVALAKHPRVALRHNDGAHLERLAASYRDRVARPATVFDEGLLRGQPTPRTVLSLPREGDWEVIGGGAWLWDEKRRPGKPLTPPAVRLAVAGEIVLKRFRVKSNKRGEKELVPSNEQRSGVLDLHTDEGILRVVEGLTQLDGWDLDGLSLRIAFRRFLESDHGDIAVHKRICQPTRKPQELDDMTALATGWPAWEEHTRGCRALYGL